MPNTRGRSVSILAGAVALAAAFGAGCGAGYQYNRTARRYGGDLPFTLVNDTPVTVCYVQLDPSTDNRWGDDWLGPHETIPPGGARTFAIQGGPAWDIRAKDCSGQILGQAMQVPLMTPFQLTVSQLNPGLRVVPVGAYPAPPPQQPPAPQPAPQ